MISFRRRNALLCLFAASLLLPDRPRQAVAQKEAVECPSQPTNSEITGEQGVAILNELHAIRLLLEQQKSTMNGYHPTPQSSSVRIKVDGDWHVMGRSDSPITILEFTDLQCPYCRQFEAGVFPTLKQAYIDTGKVRFVSLDLPLPIHAYAVQAAEADLCAGEQRKYWEYRTAVLASSQTPTREVLQSLAIGIGLDGTAFESCLDLGKYKQRLQADQQTADELQIRGTPTFVIAASSKSELNGTKIVGAVSYRTFQDVIEQVLESH